MGCDIHMWIEKRQSDGSWKKLNRFVSSWYQEGDPYFGDARFKCTDSPYNERNYELFSILAGVRNGYGLTPIVEPRGLPSDMSVGVKLAIEKDGGVSHTPSWLLLSEVLAFNWDQTLHQRGVVDGQEYKVFKAKGSPDSWSGGVFGGGVKHITNKQMDARIKAMKPLNEYYTIIEWDDPYRECCRYFLETFIPILLKRGKPDEIRLVFYFDS